MTAAEMRDASLDWQEREEDRGLEELAFYAMLGTDLRSARLARDWTIYDVAAVAGVTGATVSRWERGLDRMKAYQLRLLQKEGLL